MRVILYCRISRDRYGAGLGVGAQEKDCRVLADGHEVVAVYTDNDISAYSGKPRPGYRRLLADLRSGRADGVVAWHEDRLHRSPSELEEYIDVCRPREIPTLFVKSGDLDLATASGRTTARIRGAIARGEVEHMIERAVGAKLRDATAGKWKGGRRPYGYEKDGVTVVPEEARAVSEATTALLAGAPLRGLVREWNAAGRRTTSGNEWRHTSFRVTMMRARNAGVMEHRGEIIGRAQWDPIVGEEQWRALVDLLQAPERRTNHRNAHRRWLGSGLYRCNCSESHVLCTNSKGRRMYRCRICGLCRDQASVDEYVSEAIMERLRRTNIAQLVGDRVDTAGLEDEAATLRARLDSLAGLFAAGEVDARQLSEGSKTIRARLELVQVDIAAAYRGTSLEGVEEASDPGVWWRDGDLDRRRAVLDKLAIVQLLPAGKGRPAGWQPGSSYFHPESVQIEWRT